MKVKQVAIFTDAHFREDNLNEIEQCVNDVAKYCHENNITDAIFAGDWHESRKSQTLKVGLATKRCFKVFKDLGITLHMIPGNHDKPLYTKEENFLQLYEDRPYMNVYNKAARVVIGDVNFIMLPFFSENSEIFMENFHEASMLRLDDKKNVLITHIAVDGVKNNDGSTVSGKVDKKDLQKYDRVIVGHYHNVQQVGKIDYIGSLLPKNSGEDNDKGFVVMSVEDTAAGAIQRVKGKFLEYETINVDMDQVSPKELEVIVRQYQESNDHITIKLIGAKENIDAVGKTEFERRTGLRLIKKPHDADIDNVDMSTIAETVRLDDSKIKDKLTNWCEENQYDVNVALNFFEKAKQR